MTEPALREIIGDPKRCQNPGTLYDTLEGSHECKRNRRIQIMAPAIKPGHFERITPCKF